MRHHFGIRKKIMLTMAFMTIIPVLVMGIVSTAQSRNIIKEQTNTLARKNLIITAQEINEKVDLLYATIQELPTNTVVLSGLRRLPDTSEAHLSYQEQLETELYSARNLLRLKMPSSYALVFPDGSCYSTYLAPGGDGRNRLDAYAWYQALSSSNYSRVWYGVSDDLFNLLGGRSLYVAGNLVVDGQTAAVALLGISTTQMERLLCSSRITTNSLVFLSSSTGDYVISSEGVPPEPELLAQPNGGTVRLGLQRGQVFSTQIEFPGSRDKWTLTMIVPDTDLYRSVYSLSWLTAALILAVCMCIAVMMLCINRWLIFPVTALSASMNQVQRGDLSVRVQPGTADEIGDLYLGFNDMVEALDNSIQTIRRDDEKRHDLEIRILQEQINPHFIRNTLNTIRWMAELKGAAGISKAISAFICMINYSFSGIDHAVSLRDELFYLEKYIYIQKLRYQNLFTYEAQVPGELLDAQIPKLILQPIVENSVLHGIAERAEAGSILVTASAADGDLTLAVCDDGIGMTPEKLTQLLSGDHLMSGRGSTHIGVYNVQERLRMLYGSGYGITIESEPERYTRVYLRLPLKMGREETHCDEACID